MPASINLESNIQSQNITKKFKKDFKEKESQNDENQEFSLPDNDDSYERQDLSISDLHSNDEFEEKKLPNELLEQENNIKRSDSVSISFLTQIIDTKKSKDAAQNIAIVSESPGNPDPTYSIGIENEDQETIKKISSQKIQEIPNTEEKYISIQDISREFFNQSIDVDLPSENISLKIDSAAIVKESSHVTVVNPPSVTGQILGGILRFIHQSQQTTAELELSPQELGNIRFSMKMSGETLNVTIFVERPEVLDVVRRHAEQFLSEIKAAGFSEMNLDFSSWEQKGFSAEKQDNPSETNDNIEILSEDLDLQPIVTKMIPNGRLHLRL